MSPTSHLDISDVSGLTLTTFPTQVTSLTSLTFLAVRNLRLAGTPFTTVGGMPKLMSVVVLLVSVPVVAVVCLCVCLSSAVHGLRTNSYGRLCTCRSLDLSFNSFQGDISANVTKLSNLRFVGTDAVIQLLSFR